MTLNRLHVTLITGWFAVFTAMVVGRAVLETGFTLSHTVALFVAWCAPVAILVKVFRGAPPRSIAQVLYDAEHPASSSAPASAKWGGR